MHHDIAAAEPRWDNRIEIAYYTLRGLKTFKTESSKLGIISPGEPFHIIEAGIELLMNWYFVRENGVVLFGTQPDSIIEPISKAEFVEAVKGHICDWHKYINNAQHRGYQAYAILTMCRGLYTYTHGEQVSKLKAAQWAQQELPEWSGLIQNALVWRKASNEGVDHAATLPETRRFVEFVIAKIGC